MAYRPLINNTSDDLFLVAMDYITNLTESGYSITDAWEQVNVSLSARRTS